MVCLYFLVGGIACLASSLTMRVLVFLQAMDGCNTCDDCQYEDECVAVKKINFFSAERIFWNEWMLIAFCMVEKKCKYTSYRKHYWQMICSVIAFALFIIPFWSKEFTIDGFLYGMTSIILLFLAIIDWNTQYIPMECNILIFLCGLIHLYTNFSNWLDYIIGLFAVSGFLLLLDRISTPILKKQYGEDVDQVIGDGDIKLMAATGLLLGWKLNFIALGIGCVMGSVIHLILMKIKGSGHRLAFGPYLSLGVYITMICGEQLVSWYLNFLGVKPL